MNGYQAYKYYLACKLHFTQKAFDVFNNSRVNYPLETFLKRNDKNLFEKVAKRFDVTRNLIDYYVSNFSKGLDDFIYLPEEAEMNYLQWKSYKQSFTYNFNKDISFIEEFVESTNYDYPIAIWRCYLNYKIEYQSFFVLNEHLNILDKIEESNSLLFEKEILRIRKMKGFLSIPENVKDIVTDFKNRHSL